MVSVRCPVCDQIAAPDAAPAGACASCGAAFPASLAAMPTIDISQLTALDDRAPRAPDPPRRADAFAPPSAASFAPPRAPGDAGDDQVIGVERSTRAIRIENEFRAAQAQAEAARPASRGSASSPGASGASHAAQPPFRASASSLRGSGAQPALRESARSIGSAPRGSASSIAAPEQQRARGSRRGAAFAIALIAAVAIGVAAIALRPRSAVSPPAGGVSIRIIAREPTEVTIDGHAAGKTPLTLQRPLGTSPVLIGAPGTARQVIPDRDQTVDVTPR